MVDGVNSTAIPNNVNPPVNLDQIAVPTKPLDDPELAVVYKNLISAMQAKGMSGDQIRDAVTNLETLTDQILKEFAGLDVNRSDVRRWLVKTIDKQLKDPGSHPLKNTEDFSIRSWVMIGRRELYSLVNVKRKNLGFFQRIGSGLATHSVTRYSFRELFHPEKDDVIPDNKMKAVFHEIFHRKTVELGHFATTLEDEVFPFARSVSSNELSRTLRLFAAKKFVMMDKENMSTCVQTTLFNLAMKNIEAAYPSSKDKEIPDNEKNRNALTDEITRYLSGKEIAGSNIYDVMGLTDKKDVPNDKAKELKVNYFKDDDRNSILFANIASAYGTEVASGKLVDMVNVFSSAGLATLWGEAGGLINHLETEGLHEQDFNKKLASKYKHKNDAMEKFVTSMFLNWGVIKDGPKEWRGFTTVGPTNGTPLNTWVYWMLKHPKDVGNVKLDKPPVPTENPIPVQTDKK
jgi:hypothetical protein